MSYSELKIRKIDGGLISVDKGVILLKAGPTECCT
jgi:hypothetical protein